MHLPKLSAALVALALISALPAAACTRPGDSATLEAEVIRLVNVERKRAGLRALAPSDKLEKAAQGHACDIAKRKTTSHVSANGATLANRLRAAGYRYRAAAENTGRGFSDATVAVKWWMASKYHRANILNADVTEIGVGLALSDAPESRKHWVLDFGTSR